MTRGSTPRPIVADATIDGAIRHCHDELKRRMAMKGRGAFISPHEALGAITEEHKELIDAVQSNALGSVYAELTDLAVGAIFAMASIRQGGMD
ncbi:MAG TPA: hypothetical protein VM243_08425 [Phycisphaerae bacterium]|nr:hypothetical protein [Phycisphaerae bacterium]